METLWKLVAKKVAAARTERGLTQAELAAHAGVHRVTLCNLESGKIKELGLSKVHAILSCLNLKLDIVSKPPEEGATTPLATSRIF
jgi:transcriptional regulator with XRE-family HTH domain